jgi:hypothetical protein
LTTPPQWGARHPQEGRFGVWMPRMNNLARIPQPGSMCLVAYFKIRVHMSLQPWNSLTLAPSRPMSCSAVSPGPSIPATTTGSHPVFFARNTISGCYAAQVPPVLVGPLRVSAGIRRVRACRDAGDATHITHHLVKI